MEWLHKDKNGKEVSWPYEFKIGDAVVEKTCYYGELGNPEFVITNLNQISKGSYYEILDREPRKCFKDYIPYLRKP